MPPSATNVSFQDKSDLDLLFDFLRFRSVSTKPDHAPQMRACADWLCALLRHGGFQAEVAETGGHPAVLARDLWQRFSLVRAAGLQPLWQLDGRPMSGDVGAGTAHAAVRLLRAVGPLAPPGPLQLAGGTNLHTLTLVEALPAGSPPLAGVAFGSVARHSLQDLLQKAQGRGRRLLDLPDLLTPALTIAQALVHPWTHRGQPATRRPPQGG